MEREGWMEANMDCIPTISRQEIKDRQKKEEEKEKQKQDILDQPGMHSRELNPYWKEGGTGLPQENKEQTRSVASTVPRPGDGGISWLRRAYQRCEEKAKEEGRSLEEVVAERWGSLKKLEQMIKDSEKGPISHGDDRRDQKSSTNHQQSLKKNRFMKPGDADEIDNSKKERTNERKNRNSSHEDKNSYRSGSGSHENSSSRSHSHSRSDSNSRSKTSRRYQDIRHSSSNSGESSASRSKSQSPRRYKSRHSRSRSRSGSYNRRRSRERPRSISQSSDRSAKQEDRGRDKGRSIIKNIHPEKGSHQGRFLRPCEIDPNDFSATEQQGTSARFAEKAPTWKKLIKPVETIEDKKLEGKSEQFGLSVKTRRSPPLSGSESSSDSSGKEQSESDSEVSEQGQKSPSPEVRILSEKEMNDMGAKIVKAELMGDDELAQKLKMQLEAARQAKVEYENTGKSKGHGIIDEDNVVVLTRMDRTGMIRPVPERQHPMEPKKGRRKNKKVKTHGNVGERKMYFDDDDRFDLKELVRREKMGTAEDQNLMFARLAGRHMDRADEDFQVDDIFEQRAAKQLSESKMEEKERSLAILEHKRTKGAMDNCHFCFENLAKHLIVSIGVKVYLCLPNCHSLTEGHCLIVPMQHVTSGTAVDEEVWNEMQTFRKHLTKMFSEHNQDVVFMETSMHLKRFPHMNIECVPMEKEVGDLAPIYFKKAIQDAGPEWAHNKKLVDISQKDVRRSIPKGFPYFAVDFGLQGGFAHVIEDEYKFPSYFGREIIGGMIDADPQLWRKPKKDNFDDQRKKVLQFAEMWKPHDWTQSLKKDTTKY